MRLPKFLRRRPPPDTPEDTPEGMHLYARVDALEDDMQSVRSSINSTHASMRRMSGKVYRGVQLGDTVDAPMSDADANVEPNGVEFEHSKADLYRRAAELRGR